MGDITDDICDQLTHGVDWLKHLVFGEFDETRSISVLVATMLVGFVPGVIIVISARDLTAILVRLAKHPEKRDEVEEWMLLIACAIPLMLPVFAAAAGAVVAGVGAVIGGVAGSEAGALLRVVCLLLMRSGELVLADVVGFLRKFVKGDILKVLGDIKFLKYQQAMTKVVVGFLDKLVATLRRIRTQLRKLPAFRSLEAVLNKMQELETAFYDVQQLAMKAIPLALARFDELLQRVLAQSLPHNPRLAAPGVPAPLPTMMADSTRPPVRTTSPLGQISGGGKGPKPTPQKPVPASTPAKAGTTETHAALPKPVPKPASELVPKPASASLPKATPKPVPEKAPVAETRNVHPESPRQGASAPRGVPPGALIEEEPLVPFLSKKYAEDFGGAPSDYVSKKASYEMLQDGKPVPFETKWIENVSTGRPVSFRIERVDDFGSGLNTGITSDGVVGFTVSSVNSPISGRNMFEQMMDFYGDNVSAVQGKWVSLDNSAFNKNLGVVNALTAKGVPVEDAILSTWTGQQSTLYGFGTPTITSIDGIPGKYTWIETLWTKRAP